MERPIQHGLHEKRYALLISAVIALYLVLGSLYAILTPPWQAPDEPAHYNYVQYVAERGQLPELRPGDYPSEYLEEIKARRFPPDMSIAPLRYEAHQPPLYYMLAAPIYRLAALLPGSPTLFALRLFSVWLGAATLWVSYRIVRTAMPERPTLALGTAAFGATLPMHLAITASVNNDVLSGLLLNIIVWQLVSLDYTHWTFRRATWLALSLGLALLTKMQSYVGFGLTLVALAWDTSTTGRTARLLSWRNALLYGMLILGISGIIALPWLARNISIYGLADPLAMARHDAVVEGQLTTAQYIAAHGPLAWIRFWAVTTFQSFWGQFGWMGVPLPSRIYQVLAWLTALVMIGLATITVHGRHQQTHTAKPIGRLLALLVTWGTLTFLGYVWYNTRYVQPQGRYLFPALTVWGLAFTSGLQGLLRYPRPAWVSLGLLTLIIVVTGMFAGHLNKFTLALTMAATLGIAIGSWVEHRQAGIPLLIFYSGMAAFALFCLYAYILPHLR